MAPRPTTRLRSLATAAAAVLAWAPAAQAATQFFEGSFQADDALAIFSFALSAPGDLSATTFSHSGGTSAAGRVVPGGGFAPVLSLFDGAGELVYNVAGSANTCAGSGSFCWDGSLHLQAAPVGRYTLVLSQDGNDALGGPVNVADMASFFSRSGEPAYTSVYLSGQVDTALRFVRVDGARRSGDWALDIGVDANVSQVPEPGGLLLSVAGLACLAGLGIGRPRPPGQPDRMPL